MSRVSHPFRGNPTRFKPAWSATVPDHAISLAWSRDGARLAVAAVSGPVAVFDAASGAVRHTLAGHGFGTTAVAWGAGATLATAGQDGKVRLWDADAGTETAALAGGAAWVERLAWSPDAKSLASAAGRKLKLWDMAGQLLRAYPDHASTISDVTWRPGSSDLTSSCYGRVTVWTPESDSPKRVLEWKGSVLALAWSPDSKYLATGDQDSTVHFWIYKSGTDLQMSGYPMKVRELSWDKDGRFLATGGGSVVTVWDCSGKGPEGTTPLSLEAHDEAAHVSTLAFQKSGPLLASGGSDGRAVLWHPGKFKKALDQQRPGSGVTQVAWSPDDTKLAVGCEGGEVAVYTLI